MSNTMPSGSGIQAPSTKLVVRFLPILILICASLFLAMGLARAADTDEEYLKIFNLMEQGDTLQKNGDPGKALVKYREAEVALKSFRRDNPTWNPKLVSYRWNDLASKIAVAQDAAPAAGANPGLGASASQAAPAVKAPAAPGGSAVKLLQAGAEPRKVLRLAPKAGDQQTLGMTMKMGIEIKMGEMEMPAMKIPPISMDMTVSIKEVSAGGDISYEMVMGEASLGEDADSSPEIIAAMKGSLDGVKGMTGTAKMSNRGINLGSQMKAPSSANEQMRQALDQVKDSMDRVSAPLPEEAVGVGARWESGTTVKAQGMNLKQVATYELVSLEGDRVVIKSTINQNAANQKISNPSMPGLKVDVSKMTGKGGGSATWELSKILPVQGNIDLKSETNMGVPVGGEQQTMSMNMDMSLQMQSK
jgi:hypothetical protein